MFAGKGASSSDLGRGIPPRPPCRVVLLVQVLLMFVFVPELSREEDNSFANIDAVRSDSFASANNAS